MTNQTDAGRPGRRVRWWHTRTAPLAFVLIGILVIAGAALSVYQKRQHQQDSQISTPNVAAFVVGDCLVITSNVEAGVHRTDCTADPSYTVGAVYAGDQSCANGNYADYTWTVKGKPAGRLCLVQNLTADHCYRTSLEALVIEQLDCAGTTSDARAFEVTARTDDLNAAPCTQAANTYTYPVPPRTYCVVTAEADAAH
ncbi:LppU/SCO3897 family protein [Mycobacterium sp. BMJ-28]